MKHRPPSRIARRAGVTLVESVISTIIVGVMLATALTTIGAASRTRLSLSGAQQGKALAYELMTEIVATHFEDPDETPAWGPEPSEGTTSRVDFDDVDDYFGWTAKPPQSVNGKELPGLTGWTRSAAIVWAQPATPMAVAALPSDLKRITVSVTDPQGRVTTLEALRTSAGPLEQPGSAGQNVTSWMGTEIQIGADHLSGLISGTALLNAPGATTPNLLINGGIEEGTTDGWRMYGGTATLDTSTSSPHSGVHLLRCWARSSKDAGAGQDLTKRLVSGATYEAEFWLYNSSPSDDFRIMLQLDSTGDGVVTSIGAYQTINSSWAKVTATFSPTWNGTLTSAHIQIESQTWNNGFRIDDARLYEVP